jgi:membrane fusion protein (multidrug efflux system)
VGRQAASRIAVFGALATALAGCKKPPPPPPPAPTVRVATLQTRSIELIREWLATLDGSTNAEIRPQVSGYIEQQNYAEGSNVEQGTLMFTIDKRPFVAAAEKAKGDYENAVAAWRKSRNDVLRYTPLVKQHALSKETLDDARSATEAGAAQVESAKGALAIAKLNLEWAEVRSPIAGLAGIAQTRVGNLVNPNLVLAVVSTLDPIRASVNISEREYLQFAERLNRINDPRYANARILELILIDGRVHPYRVRRAIVNREVNPTTGTLLIQSLFPNPGNILRPGMFAKVRVRSGLNQDTLLVPERAVVELQGQHQVGVIGPDGRAQIRSVKLGRLFDHSYVVESGLARGEKVIVEGLQKVQPGTKVNVQEEAPPPATAAAEPREEP